ncbi:cupin domain-containing protein [Piscinibacter gummiphilus]|uniref:Cupin domain-containing protein n=1 Tax=Piscinibacter gummiphilus TaxID=946333 RepID=A0ABZ0CUR2_9BURK|nr:cupin domain-containing protein [Piscinibacter gummiphilus]WOB08703.1 cupin domain-containing protein [Piscinibacter gummiphilus]
MHTDRIYPSAEFFQPTAEGEPLRSVVVENADAVIVAWHVAPGQCIPAHVHPAGQDTWTILSGTGQYRLDHAGTAREVYAGDVVVAPRGCVHGVYNHGRQPLRFISVVSPGDAGYERLDA